MNEHDKTAWENGLLTKYGIAQPVDEVGEIEDDMTCRIAYLWDARDLPGNPPS
jgi:hypothetical protein